MSVKRIGVLTSGGDAPGMNPCVRAVVRSALYHGIECYGIRRGWNGLITGDVVNVRKGPGTNYGVITTVKEGETVEVFNFFTIKNVKWACTNRGWICMDFMRYNPI